VCGKSLLPNWGVATTFPAHKTGVAEPSDDSLWPLVRPQVMLPILTGRSRYRGNTGFPTNVKNPRQKKKRLGKIKFTAGPEKEIRALFCQRGLTLSHQGPRWFSRLVALNPTFRSGRGLPGQCARSPQAHRAHSIARRPFSFQPKQNADQNRLENNPRPLLPAHPRER